MSDENRDVIAETIGDVLSAVFANPAGLVLAGAAVVVVVFRGLLVGFPLKKHSWCDGKGHWGVGPFRRKCARCGGSGLVQR